MVAINHMHHLLNDNYIMCFSDLGNHGLKGHITAQISLLSNLISLDLSLNLFTGRIPETLTMSPLKLLLLNNNDLEGEVLARLYAIFMHGGVIYFDNNKGLCGIPSSPKCPAFWESGGLSTKVKILIGIASGLILLLGLSEAVYISYRRRCRNEYIVSLAHDIMSRTSMRNNSRRRSLQEQESSMLELGSQEAKTASDANSQEQCQQPITICQESLIHLKLQPIPKASYHILP